MSTWVTSFFLLPRLQDPISSNQRKHPLLFKSRWLLAKNVAYLRISRASSYKSNWFRLMKFTSSHQQNHQHASIRRFCLRAVVSNHIFCSIIHWFGKDLTVLVPRFAAGTSCPSSPFYGPLPSSRTYVPLIWAITFSNRHSLSWQQVEISAFNTGTIFPLASISPAGRTFARGHATSIGLDCY